MTGSFSLIFQDAEKRRPSGAIDVLAQMAVADHPCHVQVFDADAGMPFSIALGGLETG